MSNSEIITTSKIIQRYLVSEGNRGEAMSNAVTQRERRKTEPKQMRVRATVWTSPTVVTEDTRPNQS